VRNRMVDPCAIDMFPGKSPWRHREKFIKGRATRSSGSARTLIWRQRSAAIGCEYRAGTAPLHATFVRTLLGDCAFAFVVVVSGIVSSNDCRCCGISATTRGTESPRVGSQMR
jgi:hypothetical protein